MTIATVPSIEEIQKFARELVKKYPNSIGCQKCEACFWDWERTGKDPAKKPPYFPIEYQGNCPCTGKLRQIYPF
ncbi:MAG: hypothetical protein A2561_04075 [Candidatus Staskawiczbacteria bacterium RIFOXYD1_FULL_32_13]|uniref:Uncharacterized protein n=1 Tax=Candidatus Staskawiczbacteria bacterium RIFOXYD1_FULL_32_13 TaxID=1802234 RepID=A0A1G2JPT7_9BACT|nr:MAG: hypothetical protein UR22_C0030G0004 [Parcubacteria group bacterium GW2011_GWC2_32_10]OGZ87616.1 MAG: hypothetical protein A2463_01105 [Candidatus Staskawiczbacteria bacterium RIFOXYC2_FULL_32_10]OGZ89092.1 MAG: hypothetical protein A2561_04075 [Candidatus Staskawiczbacteria bacterium RIFOXYD1_FULL_32_13]